MTTYEAKYVYIHPYVVVHLKCVKILISSAVLWCVASTHTRLRNLITTTPSPSWTELRCLNYTCFWPHDRRANHLLGPPVMDAKAGAVSWSFHYPSRTRWTDMQQWILYYWRRSNIIVRLLEEAKSQAQTERGSCERSRGAVPWSTSQALAWDKIAIV